MKKSTALTLFLLLAGTLILSGCAGISAAISPRPTATAIPPVQSASGVTAEGRILPASSTYLFFSSPGQVAEVKVKAGDKVKKNDLLASLGDRETYLAAVSAAKLELATAQRQSDDLKTQADLATNQANFNLRSMEREWILAQQKLTDLDTKEYQTRLDTARDTANKAKDDLKTARENFDKVKDMDPANANRKTADNNLKDAQKKYDTSLHERDLIVNELDLAKAQVSFSEARLNEARRQATNRANGPDPADQALVDARLANAKTQLTSAQAALSRLDLVAPYDGTVVKVDVTTGDKAVPNQPVILFADFSKWYVETTDLAEKEVVSIQIGQKTTFIPDALPELKLTGAVEAIGSTYVLKSGDITYVVRIPVDSPNSQLRWGMTVRITFKPPQ